MYPMLLSAAETLDFSPIITSLTNALPVTLLISVIGTAIAGGAIYFVANWGIKKTLRIISGAFKGKLRG